MPKIDVIFFKDEKGQCPVMEWLGTLPKKVQEKADVRLERLAAWGHELRRPEVDYLCNEIYELRWRLQSVNYRILYFFHGREAVILTQGFTKEEKVPAKEIMMAIQRKTIFRKNPQQHSFMED